MTLKGIYDPPSDSNEGKSKQPNASLSSSSSDFDAQLRATLHQWHEDVGHKVTESVDYWNSEIRKPICQKYSDFVSFTLHPKESWVPGGLAVIGAGLGASIYARNYGAFRRSIYPIFAATAAFSYFYPYTSVKAFKATSSKFFGYDFKSWSQLEKDLESKLKN